MKLTKFIICIFFLIIAFRFSYIYYFDNKKAYPLESSPKYKLFSIKTGKFKISVSANGKISPIDRIEIKSKASGIVEELPVEVGDFIHKGDLIARLDQKDERAEVEQMQANLDIANAELKQSKQNFERRQQLFKKGLISEEVLGETKLKLAIAKGKLIQVKTDLERAVERLSDAVVRAPIDGIILQKYVEEGQIIVSGVSNVSGGSPIVDIADMRLINVEAGVDEIDIGRIKENQLASVVAEAYPEKRYTGTIVRIAPEAVVEQNVTLFKVIIEVENTDGKLKSGMNTDVEVIIVSKENVLLAPTIALKLPEDKTGSNSKKNIRRVLLKKSSNYIDREVTIGFSNYRDTEILSGLDEGDIIAIPMNSRSKSDNEKLKKWIKNRRSFGGKKS